MNANKTFNLSHVYTAAGNYTVIVGVTDYYPAGTPLLTGTGTFTVNVVSVPFQVTSFAPTAAGFDVTFSQAVNMNDVHLYDGMDNNDTANQHFYDPSIVNPLTGLPCTAPLDVTLVGAVTGTIHGSLIWDAATNTAEFVKTDARSAAFIDSVLAPDTYTVTLYSRNDSFDPGWVDDSGDLLLGGNYTATFTVAPSAQPVLTLPDFARRHRARPSTCCLTGRAGTRGISPAICRSPLAMGRG